MKFDGGYPDGHEEPGQNPSVYCEDCGLSYPVDFARQEAKEPAPESVTWGLALSFWIDTPAYSDRDRQMFVAGYEFCRIAEFLENDPNPFVMAMSRENESRVRMAAGKFGRKVLIEACAPEHDPDGTWNTLTVERRS